ncbi:MAG: LysR family transcriptional regulator [Bacteroidota bacterium]|nr:LysR family transcriptional regulator [Bacteroidota bacterium]
MATSIKNLLKGPGFKINGSLWIESKNKRFFGPGPVELLEHIADTGSISKAAKQMQMSYKKAWQIVNNLNAMAARPLVVAQTGGEKGGGSVITDDAKQLIAHYHLLRQRFQTFLEKESALLQ